MSSSIVTFGRAVRKGSHVIIGLYGESGSGKTYSAILLGRGLAGPTGKLALLDTETGRGLIYAKVAGGYDYAELTPPFTPERYSEAVKAAEAAGYDVLVIDSASHEWEGLGGILETADASNKQGLVKWAAPKARHKKFVQTLLSTRMHLVLCLRAKEKMVQARNPATGKEEIVSQGFVSVQDKRFIYETTVQLFMRGNGKRGTYAVEKCPEDLLGAFPEGARVSVQTGQAIAEWVAGGAPIDHAVEALKREAEEAAAGGTEAFRAWWASDAVKPRRAALRDALPNLQSIAAEADAERERQHTQFAPAGAAGGQQDDGLADPFGAAVTPFPKQQPEPTDAELDAQAAVEKLIEGVRDQKTIPEIDDYWEGNRRLVEQLPPEQAAKVRAAIEAHRGAIQHAAARRAAR